MDYSHFLRKQKYKNKKYIYKKEQSHIALNIFWIKDVVEKPAETLKTSIRLVSHLVRAPNSKSGGHYFESPMRRELGVATKSRKTLGVRSFYNVQKNCYHFFLIR